MTMPRTRRNQVGRVEASHILPYDLWAGICSLLDLHSAHALISCCRWLFWNARQLLRPLNVRVEHLEPLYWSVETLHDLECILPPLLHSPSTQRSRRPPRRWADEMPSARRTPALTSSGQPPQRQPVAHPTGLRRRPWRKARVQKISRLRVGLHIARRRNRQARSARRAGRFRIPRPVSSSVSSCEWEDEDITRLGDLRAHLATAPSLADQKDLPVAKHVQLVQDKVQLLEHASQLGSATFTEKAMQFILEPLPPYQGPSESPADSDSSGTSSQSSLDILQSIHTLRKRWGDEPICANVARLKHVVAHSLTLTRLWLKFARTHGLLTWAEVTNTHALDFVDTCHAITHSSPLLMPDDPWYRVPKSWLSALESMCMLDRVIGVRADHHDMPRWEPCTPHEHALGSVSPMDPPVQAQASALWVVQNHHPPSDLDEQLTCPEGDSPSQFILAIPDTREDWLAHMALMEGDGHAWRAVTGYELSGIPIPDARAPMTHTRYGHTRKLPQKASVALHWYIVGTGSWDVRKYIACLSKLCHRKRLKWHMPPRHVFATSGTGAERKLFWDAWELLLQERKRLYSTRISLKTLGAHMERVRSILPLAPQKRVCQIFGLSEAWTLPYDKRSTLIYCIATIRNGRKHIGQTGGRGTLR